VHIVPFQTDKNCHRSLPDVKNIPSEKKHYVELKTFDSVSKFKSGIIFIDDAEGSGRPSTSKMDETVARIKEFFHKR
jgi:hypothetical protein